MPIRLDTVLKKVEHMSNKVNSDLLKDFYQHMKDNGTSENYQKGNLKARHQSPFWLNKIRPTQEYILNRISGNLDKQFFKQIRIG